jgi:electron transport complex protein RnfA
MAELKTLFFIFVGASIAYNILLVRFYGLCPFFGVSTKIDTAIGMGAAVTFVMTVATSVTWLVWRFILEPLGVGEFLYIVTFILVIAGLVQLEEIVLRKTSPTLFKAMGIYLPLITTNCAILATAIEGVKPGFFKLNLAYSYTFIEAVVFSLGMAVGFTIAIILFAGIRERLEVAPLPPLLKGVPMVFINAALMSLAFAGFVGLFGL